MICKYVLEKDEKTAVLCGVKHIGELGLYDQIQREIDLSVVNGHIFFYEGVNHDPSIRLTRNARRLLAFWKNMTGKGYPALAERKQLETQGENLSYPREGINADISYEELVSVCDRAGMKCSWFLLYAVSALIIKKPTSESEYPFTLRILRVVAKRRFDAWFGKTFQALLNRSTPFVVDYRNETIFRTFQKHAGQKNFLLYGVSHLSGLLTHFEGDGWRIVQRYELQ